MTAAKIKVTAIQTPSPDNTVMVARQLKESIETAQRLRGDPNDSFVRVGELTQGGLWKLVNGVLTPASVTPQSIVVADSITGVGTLASPIELSGDSASPGNTMLYGTNSSGVKGWYAQPSSAMSPLTTKGDVYTHSNSSDARLPVGADGFVLTADSSQTLGIKWAAGSGGSSGLPATIPDLQYWFQADVSFANTTAGVGVATMQNSNPLSTYSPTSVGTTGATKSGSTLNSRIVGAFGGTIASAYRFAGNGIYLGTVTLFVVFNPAAVGYGDFTGSISNNALQAVINPSLKLEFFCSGITSIGAASAAFTIGTWAQANGTYDHNTGAWAMRFGRSASGSGTNVQTMSASNDSVCYLSAGVTQFLNGSLAEMIIYNRVLTGTEITNVETYLNTKWGV